MTICKCLLQCGIICMVFSGNVAFCQDQESANSDFLPDDPTEWKKLSADKVDEITLRNLRRIMWATHVYADANDGKLPPAAVPNKDLPPEKRLSGLVLLLPHLGVAPSYLDENDQTWKKWKADNVAAKKLFASINLKKAWDDPDNENAARTLVSSFLAPSSAVLHDEEGNAVSHFAFLRGGARADNKPFDNGAFPMQGKKTHLTFAEILDGTVATLAVGQIQNELGPWIAAGPSTARHLFHPAAEAKLPTFGSEHEGAAYFAYLDGSVYFFDMAAIDREQFGFLAGRNDRVHVDVSERRFPNASAWKKSKSDQNDNAVK